MDEFATKWKSLIDELGIHGDMPYKESAEKLRFVVRSNLLNPKDIATNPKKFFLAHRLLVNTRRGTGFCVRFTVQFNLFAGTVLGLGNDRQIAQLDDMQRAGKLGCFALTEKLAGVNSGLVVQTTCEWNVAKQKFILNSATEGSQKNWISQGLTADKACVIADLRIKGKSYGPHGFLIDMRDEKSATLMKGITVGDMGLKTTANDLDNAWIAFNNVELDANTLLSKYAEIRNDEYFQTTKEKMRIEVIGQRLLSGRICIAQAALVFCQQLFEQTKQYAAKKKCWSPQGEVALLSIPHIANMFKEGEAQLEHLMVFALQVENKLSECLVKQVIPPQEVITAIAVCKIVAVENAILLAFRLKQEVGSFALMGGVTGFEHVDFLTCCKFAEGDSRILQQKLARDEFRMFSMLKGDTSQIDVKSMEEEIKLMQLLQKQGKDKWEESYQLVFQLAEAIQNRVVLQFTHKPLRKAAANL